MRAGSYLQTAARSDASHLKGTARFLDDDIDIMKGIVHTNTGSGNHLNDVTVQDESYVRSQRPQNPLPTRALRSCKNVLPLTKHIAPPKKAVIHNARTNPETHSMQTTVPNKAAKTDALHCTNRQNRIDLRDRSEANEMKQTFNKDDLIRDMKTEIGDLNDIKLTENLGAIIKKLVKSEPDTDMTATKEGETEEDGGVMKKPPLKCPNCEKYKQSASDLK